MYNRSYINSDGQCLSICFYGYGKNTATSTCDKCSSLSKYIESTGVGCVDEQTVPYILIDPYNNIFELCYSSCALCTRKETTEHNCLSCQQGFYLQPDNSKCESSYCIKDDTERKCINCASLHLLNLDMKLILHVL